MMNEFTNLVDLASERVGGAVDAEPFPMHGHAHSLSLNLPPLGALIFTAEA